MSKFQKGSIAFGTGALVIAFACMWTNHNVAALALAIASLMTFVTSGFAAAATGEGDGK
jgi:hypothetical protein